MLTRRAIWPWLQVGFVLAVVGFAIPYLSRQWAELEAINARLTPDWLGVALSGLVVLSSYVVLIATWRATVQGWGDHLAAWDAARIWCVSNLGRYLPGKIWQIGAMGALAQAVGVSPVAAVGSALVVSIVHLIVGFAVVALTGAELFRTIVPVDGILPWIVGGMVVTVIATPWLLPRVARLATRLTGRQFIEPHLPPQAIWIAAAGSAIGWLLFGVAFHLLSGALLGRVTGTLPSNIAVFTLSYLTGFLVLFAPGGIGARELAMGALLARVGAVSGAEAALLVVASRLWLTLLELAPGLLFLAFGRPRPASPPLSDA